MITKSLSRRSVALIASALILAGMSVALPASSALSLASSRSANTSASLTSSVCRSAPRGYYEVTAAGNVFAFGGARFYGSLAR